MAKRSCKRCPRVIFHICDDLCERCSATDTLRNECARGRHRGGLDTEVEKLARRLGIHCPLCNLPTLQEGKECAA